MTARSPFSFPGDRTFAGWWRQFAPLQPTAVWAGHFLIQNIELLTRIEVTSELDALSRFLLQEINRFNLATIDQVQSRLHLGSALPLLLADLQRAGLICPVESAWSLTPLGREAMEGGLYPSPRYTRQSFRFLDLRPHAEPFRIPRPEAIPCLAWPESLAVPQGLTFGELRPLLPEVDILPFSEDSVSPPAWQRIPIIRTDRLSVAVVAVTAETGSQLYLLGLKPDSWTVPALEPLLILPINAVPSTSLEGWRRAWRDWCLARQIAEDEIAACSLEREQHRLRVRAPQVVLDRLKAARSDVFKLDTWLVAGEGLWREGALIVLNV